jgi:hypothetical protein
MRSNPIRYGWFPPAAVLLVAGTCAWPQSPDVDEVIDRFAEAIGGRENIAAIDNLVYSSGTYTEGDYRSNGDSTMSVARPWFKLVGDKREPGSYMEGYDGAAWEWFADPGVVIRTVNAASEAIRHYAGIEHPLIDYASKSATAELLGEVEFDTRPVYVIRLTRRDGFIEQFYIDQETFLINASGGEAPIHAFGSNVASITRISDYRDVAGMLVAHRFESTEAGTGRTLSAMQWGRIDANQALPDNWFSPPVFERTPLQHFIESIYSQRADPRSAMWTYDEFKRAHPGVDTSQATGFAGYQVLKMGDVATAVLLLERNVQDYPGSARAYFELGRAYQSAGKLREAREAYQDALAADGSFARARDALQALSAM